jgi:hypothetical protein
MEQEVLIRLAVLQVQVVQQILLQMLLKQLHLVVENQEDQEWVPLLEPVI